MPNLSRLILVSLIFASTQLGCRSATKTEAALPQQSLIIECRILELAQDVVLPDFLSDLQKTTNVSRMITEQEMMQIIHFSQKSNGIKQITAPRVTILDGQTANVTTARQYSYVADYDEKGSSEGSIFEPKIEVVQAGATIDVTAGVNENGKSFDLNFRATVTDFTGFDEWAYETPSPQPKPLKVQTPNTQSWVFATRQPVPQGHALLVGKSSNNPDNKRLLAIILPVVFVDGQQQNAPR